MKKILMTLCGALTLVNATFESKGMEMPSAPSVRAYTSFKSFVELQKVNQLKSENTVIFFRNFFENWDDANRVYTISKFRDRKIALGNSLHLSVEESTDPKDSDSFQIVYQTLGTAVKNYAGSAYWSMDKAQLPDPTLAGIDASKMKEASISPEISSPSDRISAFNAKRDVFNYGAPVKPPLPH